MEKTAELLIRSENGKWKKDASCLISSKEIKKLSIGLILDLEDEKRVTQYKILAIQTTPLVLKTEIIGQIIKVKKI